MNSPPIVFRGTTSSASYEKICQSNKTWLIRESESYDGMITIDFFDKKEKSFESCRFAHPPEGERWLVVRGNSIAKVNQIAEKVEFSENQHIPLEGLITKAHSMLGLSSDSLLIPSESEASSNYASS